MKKLILVAFVVQLVIIINAFQFGDIISFTRTKGCGCRPLTYKHFAVYVGNEEIEGKAPDQDIFHHTVLTVRPRRTYGCVFGKLQEEKGTGILDNYLDDKQDTGDHDKILGRINEKKDNCGQYNLCTNNCEHLVTYVRNGVKRTEQRGTSVEFWARFCRNENTPKTIPQDVLEINEDFDAVPCDTVCNVYNEDTRQG